MVHNHLSIKYLRHATYLLYINEKTILIDPMLSPAGTLPAIPLTRNRLRNPLISLPVDAEEVTNVDAVLVTHHHVDHFDVAASQLLNKKTRLYCQPCDVDKFAAYGFSNVVEIKDFVNYEGIVIKRYETVHGKGLVNKILGKSSAYSFEFEDQQLFVTGDSLLTDELLGSISSFKPKHIVVNAGSAKMLIGDPITMTNEDVLELSKKFDAAGIIAIHMDAINHCRHSKTSLKALAKNSKQGNIKIPFEGQDLIL